MRGAELVALAEALQIPVATSLNGKDAIPGTHPLSVGVVGTYSRESANRVVNRADLVCFIGTETGGMTTHFWAVPKIGTPAIQIDIDPEAIGRNYPLLAGVNGDAKVTLARMAGARRPRQRRQAQGLGRGGAGICKEWYAKYDPMLNSDAVPIRPERMCAEFTRHVPDNGIVVVDTGHAGMWMGGMYDLTHAVAELHAQRRPSRLGVSGRARRQMRRARPAGGDVHRRRRLLVSHRRDRDRGALGDQRRSPWSTTTPAATSRSAASTASMAATQTEQAEEMWTLQQGQLRPHRRGHGRGRHPGREAGRARARDRSRRSRPTGRW